MTLAVILAAGSGTRFGSDKMTLDLLGRPVWRWSYDVFAAHPRINAVGVVASHTNMASIADDVPDAAFVVLGGENRQASSRLALEAAPPEFDTILIHDGARPLVSAAVIEAVLNGVDAAGVAAASVPVTDTIKEQDGGTVRTLDRSRLMAMQTPQGARRELLAQAHRHAPVGCTDEMAMLEAIGAEVSLVEGDRRNIKITVPEDLAVARAIASESGRAQTPSGSAMEVRTGLGYDIHPFSRDPARPLMIGGVHFPEHPGLEGHSDADVLLHAVVDAVLGAAGLGDIGQHFSNGDARWKNKPSLFFLISAKELVLADGWRILNIDATVVAESPRVMAQAAAIRSTIASAAGLDPRQINVKATTNERLGSIGRNEGIAAFAVATLQRNP